MKVVVIYAHPNPRSFNAAILDVVKEELSKRDAEVRIKDLYAMNWNPVLSAADFEGYHKGTIPADIQNEQADISWADTVIMIAPVWWYSVPAMLKGYVDRVFSVGFAYVYTSSGPRGMLTGKKGLVITTSGADQKADQQTGMTDLIKRTFVASVFGFSGFESFQYKNFFDVPTASNEERQAMLHHLRQVIRQLS